MNMHNIMTHLVTMWKASLVAFIKLSIASMNSVGADGTRVKIPEMHLGATKRAEKKAQYVNAKSGQELLR